MIKQIEHRRGCMRVTASDTINLLSDCECVAVAVAVAPGHLILETCVTILDGQTQPEAEFPPPSKARSGRNVRSRRARRARPLKT
jgi:hypothetical protein